MSSILTKLSEKEKEAARARARSKRARIARSINITGVKASKRDEFNGERQPQEIPNIRTAVKWKCFDCMGWEPDGCGSLVERVRQCECPHCPLYPWRGGKFDEDLIVGDNA